MVLFPTYCPDRLNTFPFVSSSTAIPCIAVVPSPVPITNALVCDEGVLPFARLSLFVEFQFGKYRYARRPAKERMEVSF